MYTAKNDFRAFSEALNVSRDSMEHFGIRGQKWGQRRFQNSDGTLTAAGKQRYNKGDLSKKSIQNAKTNEELNKKKIQNSEQRLEKAVKIGAIGMGTAFVASRIGAKGGAGLIFGEGATAGNAARIAVGTMGAVAATGASVATSILLLKGGVTAHRINKRRAEINS